LTHDYVLCIAFKYVLYILQIEKTIGRSNKTAYMALVSLNRFKSEPSPTAAAATAITTTMTTNDNSNK